MASEPVLAMTPPSMAITSASNMLELDNRARLTYVALTLMTSNEETSNYLRSATNDD